MLAAIQPHLGEICLFLLALLGVSETMPFMKKMPADGILHSLYMKLKGKVIEEAKKELAKQEAQPKAPDQGGQGPQ